MAHCPYEQLGDIKQELDAIRELPKVKETKPDIFYLKSKGFLHFHISKEGRRWADVRDGSNWGKEIDLPVNPSLASRKSFISEVRKRHKKTHSELYK